MTIPYDPKPARAIKSGARSSYNLGKPSKYKPEYALQIVEYFQQAAEEIYFLHKNDKGDIRAIPNKFPTFERFAANIDIAYATMTNWASDRCEDGEHRYPDFAEAYQKCKNIQKACFIEGAMAGAFNPQFAALFARTNLGMNETQQLEISGNAQKPFVINTFLPVVEKLSKISDSSDIVTLDENGEPVDDV